MSQIGKIGVIGAGNMGSGIVQKIAQEGIPVVMVDLKEEFVQRGLGTIKRLLQEGVDRKIFKSEQVDQILSRITGTTDFNAVADADLVIEAVFEDKQVKTDLFQRLDQICQWAMTFRKIGNICRPVVHLNIDIGMIVAVPWGLNSICPKTLQVRRKRTLT